MVDSSLEPVESTAKHFPELNVRYLRHWPPSATGQRNQVSGPVPPLQRSLALRKTTPPSRLMPSKTCSTSGKCRA